MADNSFTLASFPFDGTCKCSRNGDTILKFSDGSYLKTHAALLKMASPVFDSMLTDCTETKTLVMEKTSRTTWVHILNHLHPGGTLSFSNLDCVNGFAMNLSFGMQIPGKNANETDKMKAKCDTLSDLLEQSRKFEFDSLFTFLDDLLFSIFPKQLDRACLTHMAADVNRLHSRLYILALRYESKLPKTGGIVRRNIIMYLQNPGQWCNSATRHSTWTPISQQVRIIYCSRLRIMVYCRISPIPKRIF